MKKTNFPVLASFVGAFLFIVLITANTAGEGNAFPLLTLLFMSELGVFVTAAGAVYGVKLQLDKGFSVKLFSSVLVCTALAIALAIKGMAFWGNMNVG